MAIQFQPNDTSFPLSQNDFISIHPRSFGNGLQIAKEESGPLNNHSSELVRNSESKENFTSCHERMSDIYLDQIDSSHEVFCFDSSTNQNCRYYTKVFQDTYVDDDVMEEPHKIFQPKMLNEKWAITFKKDSSTDADIKQNMPKEENSVKSNHKGVMQEQLNEKKQQDTNNTDEFLPSLSSENVEVSVADDDKSNSRDNDRHAGGFGNDDNHDIGSELQISAMLVYIYICTFILWILILNLQKFEGSNNNYSTINNETCFAMIYFEVLTLTSILLSKFIFIFQNYEKEHASNSDREKLNKCPAETEKVSKLFTNEIDHSQEITSNVVVHGHNLENIKQEVGEKKSKIKQETEIPPEAAVIPSNFVEDKPRIEHQKVVETLIDVMKKDQMSETDGIYENCSDPTNNRDNLSQIKRVHKTIGPVSAEVNDTDYQWMNFIMGFLLFVYFHCIENAVYSLQDKKEKKFKHGEDDLKMCQCPVDVDNKTVQADPRSSIQKLELYKRNTEIMTPDLTQPDNVESALLSNFHVETRVPLNYNFEDLMRFEEKKEDGAEDEEETNLKKIDNNEPDCHTCPKSLSIEDDLQVDFPDMNLDELHDSIDVDCLNRESVSNDSSVDISMKHDPVVENQSQTNHTNLGQTSEKDSFLKETSVMSPGPDSVLKETSVMSPGPDSVLKETSVMSPGLSTDLKFAFATGYTGNKTSTHGQHDGSYFCGSYVPYSSGYSSGFRNPESIEAVSFFDTSFASSRASSFSFLSSSKKLPVYKTSGQKVDRPCHSKSCKSRLRRKEHRIHYLCRKFFKTQMKMQVKKKILNKKRCIRKVTKLHKIFDCTKHHQNIIAYPLLRDQQTGTGTQGGSQQPSDAVRDQPVISQQPSDAVRHQSVIEGAQGRNQQPSDSYRQTNHISVPSSDTAEVDCLTAAVAPSGSLSSYFLRMSERQSMTTEEQMQFEWMRLQTFSSFPSGLYVSPLHLARWGYYATGNGDETMCFSCKHKHNNWQIGNNPQTIHRQQSPSCRFILGIDTNNVPIHGQSTTSNLATSTMESRPSQGAQIPNGVLPNSHSTSSQPQQAAVITGIQNSLAPTSVPSQPSDHVHSHARQPTTPAVTTNTAQNTNTGGSTTNGSSATSTALAPHDTLGINFDKPRYPAYAILTVRISTYGGWPTYLSQTAREMSLAGFFYAGYGDYVRCFFCGGGLRNWESGDDPWVEHARWFPRCAFVRQNRGDAFVELVLKRHAELLAEQNSTGQTVDNAQQEVSVTREDLETPASQSILEMGFDENILRAAILKLKAKKRQGRTNISSTELFELVLELNERQALGGEINGRVQQRSTEPAASAPAHQQTPASSAQQKPATATSQQFSTPNQQQPSVKATKSEQAASKQAEGQGSKQSKSKKKQKQSKNQDKQGAAKEQKPTEKLAESKEEKEKEQKKEENQPAAVNMRNSGQRDESLRISDSLDQMTLEEVRSLQEENAQLREQTICKICMDKNVSVAFLPCGHLACCEDCAPAMRTCPICREPVRGTVKTYLV